MPIGGVIYRAVRTDATTHHAVLSLSPVLSPLLVLPPSPVLYSSLWVPLSQMTL